MEKTSSSKNTKLVSTLMIAFKLVRAFTGILTTVLAAKYFGVGVDRDAYLLSSAVVIIVVQGLFGPINDTIRTKFIYIKNEHGDKVALQSISSLLSGIVILSMLVIFVMYIKADWVADIFAPGFTLQSEHVITIIMIRFVIPSIILNEVSTILISILNCYNYFFLPEILSFITSLINIFLIIFLVKYMGINVLILSSYLGLLILVVCLLIDIRRKKILLTIRLPVWAEIVPYILFSLPFYISYLTSQISNSIEKAITTNMGVGNISLLDYARKFADVPVNTLITVTSTVLTPVLVQKWIDQKKQQNTTLNNTREFQKEVRGFIGLCILILTPIIIGMTVCGDQVVYLVLVRGNFTEKFVQPVATLLNYFGFSLFGLMLYIILGQVLVVQQKVKIFAVFSLITQFIHIVMNYLLYKHLGLQIFAISSLVSHILISVILIILLKVFSFDDYKHLIKYVAIMLISLLIAWLTKSNLTLTSHLLLIIIPVSVAVVTMFICSIIFNIDEISIIKQRFSINDYAK